MIVFFLPAGTCRTLVLQVQRGVHAEVCTCDLGLRYRRQEVTPSAPCSGRGSKQGMVLLLWEA